MRTPENLLRAEARRFPIVADLLERVADLTDEEIDAAKVPLPWYRKALKDLRTKSAVDKRFAEATASLTPFIRSGSLKDIAGIQAIYNGPEIWVTGFSSDYQLQSNTLIFLPADEQGIWVNCSFLKNANRSVIVPYLKSPQIGVLTGYKAAYAVKVQSLYPDAHAINDVSSQMAGRNGLSMYGVRFS